LKFPTIIQSKSSGISIFENQLMNLAFLSA
jgi:hypothetical protein